MQLLQLYLNINYKKSLSFVMLFFSIQLFAASTVTVNYNINNTIDFDNNEGEAVVLTFNDEAWLVSNTKAKSESYSLSSPITGQSTSFSMTVNFAEETLLTFDSTVNPSYNCLDYIGTSGGFYNRFYKDIFDENTPPEWFHYAYKVSSGEQVITLKLNDYCSEQAFIDNIRFSQLPSFTLGSDYNANDVSPSTNGIFQFESGKQVGDWYSPSYGSILSSPSDIQVDDTATFEMVVETNEPLILSFNYRVNNNGGYSDSGERDILRFSKGGLSVTSGSGEKSYLLNKGTHTLVWTYEKKNPNPNASTNNATISEIGFTQVIPDLSINNGLIDFEGVNGTSVDYALSGVPTWKITDSKAHTGKYSLTSPESNSDYDYSTIALTLNSATQQTLAFDYSVSSELNVRFLTLSINGVQVSTWSGEIDWQQATFSLPAGENVVTWGYQGFGNAWIDNISFVDAPLPNITMTDNIIDFENTSGSSINYSYIGAQPWRTITDNASTGNNSLSFVNPLLDNQATSFSLEVNYEEARQLSFDFAVSSELNGDYFKFYIDGSRIASWSGEIDWREFNQILSAGSHILTWKYQKNGSITTNNDKAWLDNIAFQLVEDIPNFTISDGNIGFESDTGQPVEHTVSGASSWVLDSANVSTGNYSLSSPENLEANQSASFLIEVNYDEPQVLSFDLAINAEESGDSFSFKLVGEPEINQASNYSDSRVWTENNEWEAQSYIIPAGTYQLIWKYQKGNTSSTADNQVWIDNISLVKSSIVLNKSVNGILDFEPEGLGESVEILLEGYEQYNLKLLSVDQTWTISNSNASSGDYSFQSLSRSGDNENVTHSSFSVQVDNLDETLLSFDFALSKYTSEYSLSTFKFYIDDILIKTHFQNDKIDWQKYSYVLTAGTHKLTWSYNPSQISSDDFAWVDNISLTQSTSSFESVVLNVPSHTIGNETVPLDVDLTIFNGVTNAGSTQYAWQQVESGAPSVEITDAESKTAQFTMPDISQAYNFLFKLVITEENGNVIEREVSIIGMPPIDYEPNNSQLTANPIYAQSRNRNELGYSENATIQHHSFISESDVDWMKVILDNDEQPEGERQLVFSFDGIAESQTARCEEIYDDISGASLGQDCNFSWDNIITDAEVTLYLETEGVLTEVEVFNLSDINVTLSSLCEEVAGLACIDFGTLPTLTENHYIINNLEQGVYFIKIDPILEYSTNSDNEYSIEVFDFPTKVSFIDGLITDIKTGAPVGNADISIYKHASGDTDNLKALPIGLYLKSYVKGTYDFTFSKEGYDDLTKQLIIKSEDEGDNIRFNAQLSQYNSAPVISIDKLIETYEDTPASIQYSYTDAENDLLNVVIKSQTQYGAVSIENDVITFIPQLNFYGTDSFVLTFSDNTGFVLDETININVLSINDVPFANQVDKTIDEDTSVSITLSGSDIDNDNLTYTLTNPSAGSLVEVSNSEYTYTPNLNYNGTDSFTYSANDGTEDSASATVTINITAVNDVPTTTSITNPDTNEDVPVTFSLLGSDVDNSTLIYNIVSQPNHGSLSSLTGNQITYTPDANYFGSDSFTYQANDGSLDSNVSSVTLNLIAVNDTPIANDVTITTNEDTSVSVTLSGSDADNDNLTFTLTNPSAGSLVAVSNSEYTYSPNPHFNGIDSFTYFANDGTVDSASATVTLNITAVNDAPTTSDIVNSDTNEDALVSLVLAGVDIDGDTLTYNIVSQPNHGSLSSLTGNQITYTPDVNYFGNDSFTYQANDGLLDSNVSSVTLNLLAVNDIPQITSEASNIGVIIGTLYSYTFSAVDIDNDELSYSSNTLPSWLTLSGNVLSGTPVEADIGSYDITLTVSDASDSVSQTFTISVRASNSAPTFTGLIDTTTNEDELYELILTANDVDGDTFTFDSVGALPSWLALNGDTLSGTPMNEDVGVHSVNLSVKDNLNTTEQSFTITVANINDAPIFTSTALTQATEGLLYNYLLAVSDVDSDTLTFSASNLPSWLSLTDNALSGTPLDSDVGSVDITVSVSDNTVSVEQTFTITVVDNGIVGLSIVAPDDITMEANALMTQVNLGVAVILDDVDTNLQGTVDNPGPYGVGAHTVTWSVTDSDDNTQTDTQTVTITDTTAPDLGQPSEMIVNSVGYYSDLNKLISLTGIDLVEGEIAASLISESSLLPGRHEVLWQVADSQNNSAQVSQSIVILPQVTLGGTYLAEVGAVVSIPVTLNADAADYPVLINIDVVGKDTAGNLINLPEQDVVINEGQQGLIELDLVNVSAEDSIELTLVSASNATLSHVTTAFVTLVSTNIAPQVMLESVQNAEVRTSLFKDQGSVTINADIMDVNLNDTHNITWDSELSNTSAEDTVFSFDPSIVDEGNYSVTATVTETNTTESHSVSIEMRVDVLATTPTLDANQDSDGDGINDDLEGLGDSDGDGIADYVDNNDDTSQLPIGEGNERLQTAVGITLSLGNYIRQGLGIDATMGSMNASDFIALANNDNAQLDFTPVTPVIDFVMSGLTQVGNAVSVIIPLPVDVTLPANAQYMKYQSVNGWTAFVDEGQNTIASALLTSEGQCPVLGDSTYQSGLVEGASCIELTLVDGGIYDDDGLVNGQISDPAIISANYAPTLSIDGVSAVDEQTLVTLNANGVDPEGGALTYQWTQTAGETVTLTGENEASLTFTSPDVTSDSNLTFSVTVSDGVNSIVQATTVMVVWIPQDLSVSLTSSATSINEGGQITLDGSASVDPDGYSLSYQWTQVSGPSVTLSSPANATSGFTAPQVTSNSAVVVRLTISQGIRITSTDLSIMVNNVAVVTPPPTPAKESGGGGAINLYWLMMLLLISVWRVTHVRGVSSQPR